MSLQWRLQQETAPHLHSIEYFSSQSWGCTNTTVTCSENTPLIQTLQFFFPILSQSGPFPSFHLCPRAAFSANRQNSHLYWAQIRDNTQIKEATKGKMGGFGSSGLMLQIDFHATQRALAWVWLFMKAWPSKFMARAEVMMGLLTPLKVLFWTGKNSDAQKNPQQAPQKSKHKNKPKKPHSRAKAGKVMKSLYSLHRLFFQSSGFQSTEISEECYSFPVSVLNVAFFSFWNLIYS